MISYQQYLHNSAVPREMLDVFLDPSQPSWAQFDSELGYILGNSLPRDGLDGCATISTVQPNGARTPHLYVNRPCRINTYGNSFTQCHQVSDGETWQEYLAGHLGEPIRNFGMGGYGVYQAYRRLVRTEQSDDTARYVMLYIWGNDHLRSVMRCRYASIYTWWGHHDHRGGLTFHNNFWTNLEMDRESGQFVEYPNRLPTPESLYQMTDPDFMVSALEDDLMLQLCVSDQVDASSLDLPALNQLAELLGLLPWSTDDRDGMVAWLDHLKTAYGFAATKYILGKTIRFCEQQDKELMILLFCPAATRQLLRGEPRYEQSIVDFLDQEGLRYFDMNRVHQEDYGSFSVSIEDYMRRYSIGHYSPVGNHFFAYSLKDALVDWLEPKPLTYRSEQEQRIDFRGYLPNP